MNIIEIIGIAFGLAMDAFAVAIAVGASLQKLTFRPTFRLSFHFGLFQFLMPIIGWFAGSRIAVYIRDFDHWVAFVLLAVIGGKMIYESFSHKDDLADAFKDPTRRWTLIMLSLATSIDALAVGLSLAMIDTRIFSASLVIGIVAAGMTLVGLLFGRKLGQIFGRRMELLGGLILIGIGLKILLDHIAV
ncbi:putative manganese efflux pump MntP [Candidatus Zixiibacteriota bacterium]|nr:putative manganese efflux pump MntP [candidate division Zixibacteria bacterium]